MAKNKAKNDFSAIRSAHKNFEAALKKEGLWGKAFFNENATKQDEKRMIHLWKSALKESGADHFVRAPIVVADIVERQDDGEAENA